MQIYIFKYIYIYTSYIFTDKDTKNTYSFMIDIIMLQCNMYIYIVCLPVSKWN